MGPISVTRTIDAPRERVYDFLIDLANRPAFTDHFIADFRLERFESTGVGAAARMRIERARPLDGDSDRRGRGARTGSSSRARAGAWTASRSLTAWELVEGPSAASSEVTLRFGTEPTHPIDRLHELRRGERYFRRQWSTALSRLKDLIESGRSGERVSIAGGARLPVT